jgi:predicted small secreted protein
MKTRMHRIVQVGMALLFCAVGLLIGGCNTTRGVGRDISGAGRAIERAVP